LSPTSQKVKKAKTDGALKRRFLYRWGLDCE
jgi:hypothetical protein